MRNVKAVAICRLADWRTSSSLLIATMQIGPRKGARPILAWDHPPAGSEQDLLGFPTEHDVSSFGTVDQKYVTTHAKEGPRKLPHTRARQISRTTLLIVYYRCSQ